MWISRKDFRAQIGAMDRAIERRDAKIALLQTELEEANKLIFLADSIFMHLTDKVKKFHKDDKIEHDTVAPPEEKPL